MHQYRRLLVLLLLWGPLAVAAQPAQPLQVDLDHAAFAHDGDGSLLEVYLSFGVESLAFEAITDGFVTRIPLDLAVYRRAEAPSRESTRDPVWTDSVMLAVTLPDTSAIAPGQRVVHRAQAPLPPGTYELHVHVPGTSARPSLRLQREVTVPGFAGSSRAALSGITLATAITQSEDAEGAFYKKGFDVRPNPNQLYGRGLDQVYYYAEAYHVDSIRGAHDTYTLQAYVADANRPHPLPGLQQRAQRPARSPDVLVGSFDVSSLPSGSYVLRLALLDEDDEPEVQQERKFFVYNPDVERTPQSAADVSFETSRYAAMSPDDVEQALQHIALIATERERQRADDLQDLDEQRRFLMAFWQKRDPNPATATNEYRDQFYQRLRYANERYSNDVREGWRSDRGRVYVEYGAPAQVESHLHSVDTKPYEVWHYTSIPGEGQAAFIFLDRKGYGDFELIHATVAGERKSHNWQAEIQR